MKSEHEILLLSELSQNTENIEKNQNFLIKAFETYVQELRELKDHVNKIKLQTPKIDINKLEQAINRALNKSIESNQKLYTASDSNINKTIKKLNQFTNVQNLIFRSIIPWILIIPLSYFVIKFGTQVWMENLPNKTTLKYLKTNYPTSVEMIEFIEKKASTREGRKELQKDIRSATDN